MYPKPIYPIINALYKYIIHQNNELVKNIIIANVHIWVKAKK